jgi:hypothetical protein
VDVFLRIELPAGSDLPSAEKVFRLFRDVYLAFAVAVDQLDLWEWRANQCRPELTMEIIVEGHPDDWIHAKLNVERFHRTQLRNIDADRVAERVAERALVAKFSLWHAPGGELEYGDEPREIVEDRFVYEG